MIMVKPQGGIETVKELQDHLQIAIELEHAVIPPYLCALYSIEDGANTTAAASLHDVVVEEMLHLTLAANVLNAIGGSPDLIHPDFVPRYPSFLPHGNDTIVLNLAPFSREALAGFLQIEHPSAPHSPPQAHRYASIGQFYAAIMEAIKRLAKTHPNLFHGTRSRQITPEYYYNSGGEVVEVTDLPSALDALEIIVIEGEGHDSIYDRRHPPMEDTEELAHYYRFNQIYEGRFYQKGDTAESGPTGGPFPVDWQAGIYPMRMNPKSGDYPPTGELWNASNAFNLTYRELLHVLHQSFNGEPGKLLESVPLMFRLKTQAQGLMKVPSGHFATTAGPSFEYVKSTAAAWQGSV
jgi:hypothetical protein